MGVKAGGRVVGERERTGEEGRAEGGTGRGLKGTGKATGTGTGAVIDLLFSSSPESLSAGV